MIEEIQDLTYSQDSQITNKNVIPPNDLICLLRGRKSLLRNSIIHKSL